ncbi:alpha/beta hydrolase [Galbitalea sp. SE-J8]|uniref:alpha/beta fold hydrolase n=1 Tax=Galbitalea sp. SE-J8 TaxID=3054952 RepID=UPI00259CE5C2|nr:alpha/beta hydrolase [Galbitalea sp. SE-J8]MDM4761614.1 alpha/beta hydrolase [Galbitalea sp. SE-J8]
MSDQNTLDEFAYLASEAAAVGAAVPVHARVAVVTSEGTVSGIRWGTSTPEVVLLHGGGLNAHTWDATVLALGVPALAIDLPGHGDSGWRDDADYAPTTIAPAVAEAIARLVDAPVVVVGQSLGGLTAGVLAGDRPDLVRSTVIVDAVPFAPVDLPTDAPNPVRDFLAGPNVFPSRDAIVDRALSFGFGPDRSSVERGVALNTRVRDDGQVVFKHHLANLDAGASPFATDFSAVWSPLERATGDVLLIAAENGFVPPARVEEFLRRVPRSSVVRVSGGHNVQEERPVELAALLRDHLAAVTA